MKLSLFFIILLSILVLNVKNCDLKAKKWGAYDRFKGPILEKYQEEIKHDVTQNFEMAKISFFPTNQLYIEDTGVAEKADVSIDEDKGTKFFGVKILCPGEFTNEKPYQNCLFQYLTYYQTLRINHLYISIDQDMKTLCEKKLVDHDCSIAETENGLKYSFFNVENVNQSEVYENPSLKIEYTLNGKPGATIANNLVVYEKFEKHDKLIISLFENNNEKFYLSFAKISTCSNYPVLDQFYFCDKGRYIEKSINSKSEGTGTLAFYSNSYFKDSLKHLETIDYQVEVENQGRDTLLRFSKENNIIQYTFDNRDGTCFDRLQLILKQICTQNFLYVNNIYYYKDEVKSHSVIRNSGCFKFDNKRHTVTFYLLKNKSNDLREEITLHITHITNNFNKVYSIQGYTNDNILIYYRFHFDRDHQMLTQLCKLASKSKTDCPFVSDFALYDKCQKKFKLNNLQHAKWLLKYDRDTSKELTVLTELSGFKVKKGLKKPFTYPLSGVGISQSFTQIYDVSFLKMKLFSDNKNCFKRFMSMLVNSLKCDIKNNTYYFYMNGELYSFNFDMKVGIIRIFNVEQDKLYQVLLLYTINFNMNIHQDEESNLEIFGYLIGEPTNLRELKLNKFRYNLLLNGVCENHLNYLINLHSQKYKTQYGYSNEDSEKIASLDKSIKWQLSTIVGKRNDDNGVVKYSIEYVSQSKPEQSFTVTMLRWFYNCNVKQNRFIYLTMDKEPNLLEIDVRAGVLKLYEDLNGEKISNLIFLDSLSYNQGLEIKGYLLNTVRNLKTLKQSKSPYQIIYNISKSSLCDRHLQSLIQHFNDYFHSKKAEILGYQKAEKSIFDGFVEPPGFKGKEIEKEKDISLLNDGFNFSSLFYKSTGHSIQYYLVYSQDGSNLQIWLERGLRIIELNESTSDDDDDNYNLEEGVYTTHSKSSVGSFFKKHIIFKKRGDNNSDKNALLGD
jgi:hypothetical protein